MKRTLRLLLTVGLSLVCVSLFAQKFPNYPIPQQPDTLRILGIGNSFTDDGMMYLPELLEAACKAAGVDLTLRLQPGYDHSYNFISTFMEDHIRWHAERL